MRGGNHDVLYRDLNISVLSASLTLAVKSAARGPSQAPRAGHLKPRGYHVTPSGWFFYFCRVYRYVRINSLWYSNSQGNNSLELPTIFFFSFFLSSIFFQFIAPIYMANSCHLISLFRELAFVFNQLASDEVARREVYPHSHVSHPTKTGRGMLRWGVCCWSAMPACGCRSAMEETEKKIIVDKCFPEIHGGPI